MARRVDGAVGCRGEKAAARCDGRGEGCRGTGGSKEEESDLINFYKKYDGDVRGILEHIIASSNDDIPRFIEYYERMFSEKTLEKTKKFEKTKKEIKLLPDEKDDAMKEKDKIKKAKANKAAAAGGSMADLEKMILAKKENAFGGFMNYMENKYGGEDHENNEGNLSKKRSTASGGSEKATDQPNKKNKKRKVQK